MKKILLVLTVFIAIHAGAQVTEGKIKYDMQLDGLGSGKNDNALMNNMSTFITFKKDKALTETTTPLFQMRTLIVGNDMLMLMDGNNRKNYFRTSKAQLQKEAGKNIPDPKVIVTKEKKMILGYECIKMLIQNPDKKGVQTQIIVWVTDKIKTNAEIGGVNMGAMGKINGTPLEIDMDAGPIKTRVVAVNISLKPVPDAVFNVSTIGYTETKPGAPMPR